MENFPLTLCGQNGIHQSTRTLDRILEEAKITGHLNLSGKSLKEFPKIPLKYDLCDTVSADLSKNKLSELPTEICEFFLLETLECYHNVIRCLPDSVITLQSLTYLNLSRNQLYTIPTSLCQLPLQVLIISNNKLVSLPEEIGCMHQLMELDVACNQITILPPHIGDLKALKSLNLRRNLLIELQLEVCELRLVKLDISGNKITFLPILLRQMISLKQLIVDRNPLTSPPAVICVRGQAHIFKYLEIQAIRNSKKQGVLLELDYHRSFRKAGLLAELRIQNGILDDRKKRHTVDSGYSTSDGGDCRWSQDLHELSGDIESSRKLALRAAEITKEQRKERRCHLVSSIVSEKNNTTPSSTQSMTSKLYQSVTVQEDQETKLTNGHSVHYNVVKPEIVKKQVDALNQAQISNCSDSPDFICTDSNSQKSKTNVSTTKTYPYLQTYKEYKEKLRLQRNQNTYSVYRSPFVNKAFDTADPDQLSEQVNEPVSSSMSYQKPKEISTVSNIVVHEVVNGADLKQGFQEVPQKVNIPVQANCVNVEKHSENIPVKLETCLQNSYVKLENSSEKKMKEVENNLQTNSSVILENQLQSDFVKTVPCLQKYSVEVGKGFKRGCEECDQGLNGSCLCQKNDGETQSQKKIVHSNYLSKVDYKHSWTRNCIEDSKNDIKENCKKELENNHSKLRLSEPHLVLDFKKQSSVITEPVTSSLSIKRISSKEGQEQIDQLRRLIENKLKVTLPDDLGGALRDGILLCQLMNQLYPHSLVSIHVPSTLVPRLPVMKRRLNVENFLKSCEKTGVPKADLFKWEEVVMQHQVAKVAHTVQVLLSLSRVKLQTDLHGHGDALLSYLLVGLFVGTCLMMLLCPPPP